MAAKGESEKKPACFKLREEPGQTIMLDVRLANGDRHAFPYSYLIWVKYERAIGLYIRFSSHTVLVKGRLLLPVHQGILQQRVEWIQEEDPRHDLGPEDDPFVASITVFENTEEQ